MSYLEIVKDIKKEIIGCSFPKHNNVMEGRILSCIEKKTPNTFRT